MERPKQLLQVYMESCRDQLVGDIEAYDRINEFMPKSMSDDSVYFEKVFFNNLLIVLDTMFVNRPMIVGVQSASQELKYLANSIAKHNGRLMLSQNAKYRKEWSVLKIEKGGKIIITQEKFISLFNRVWEELSANKLPKKFEVKKLAFSL